MRRSSVADKKASQSYNVVLEIGSSVVRGGYGGECSPRFIMKSPFFSLYKINDNILQEEVRMNCLEGLRLIFLEYLQIRSKDCHVLIIENMFAPTVFRDQLFNALLNELQVLSVCFQPDMLMPIIATGCQSGTVLDIGSNECRAICIAHGRPLLNTFVATPIGVKDASNRFHRLLNKFLSSSETGDDITVDHATTAVLFEKTAVARTSLAEEAVDVTFPTGEATEKVSVVPGWLRHDCLSGLIGDGCRDEDSQDELGGLVGLLLVALQKCSADSKRLAVQNVVFAGGGAQIPGLPGAICNKLSSLLQNNNADAVAYSCFNNMERLRPLFQQAMSLKDGEKSAKGMHDISQILCRHPFPMSSLNWIGGSLFATVKMNKIKYVEREEYLLKTRSSRDDPFIDTPDWLSTNPGDWRFYGQGAYVNVNKKKNSPSHGSYTSQSSTSS